jgi:stage II sporulation protein AB (anti-sigma F factor)
MPLGREISVFRASAPKQQAGRRPEESVTPLLTLELAATDVPGITRARAAITEYAERLGFDADIRDRVRLAITEACTNCVLHAYDGKSAQSTYRLDAHMDADELVVVVQDWGAGLEGDGDTREASKLSGRGNGLKLIRALASTVRIDSAVDHGTRIEMRFERTQPEANQPTRAPRIR